MSRSAKPRIAVSGLLTSCATPETNCPTAAIFSACISLACSVAASVMSVMTTTMLVTLPCSSRMGLRFMENCPTRPRRAESAVRGCPPAARPGWRQKLVERLTAGRSDQFLQGPAQS